MPPAFTRSGRYEWPVTFAPVPRKPGIMRTDMSKVLVERPRIGMRRTYRRDFRFWDDTPMDERPSHERIRLRWQRKKFEPKVLNENLAPLRKFLRRNVGRPWDKVYSEICAQMDRGSAVQYHIWHHLRDEVVTAPHEIERGFANRPRPFFYVCPRTDLLREHYPKRDGYVRPPVTEFALDGRRYHKLGGQWYAIDYGAVDDAPIGARDVLTGEVVAFRHRASGVCRRFYSTYAARKRQLKRDELARLVEAVGRHEKRGR